MGVPCYMGGWWYIFASLPVTRNGVFLRFVTCYNSDWCGLGLPRTLSLTLSSKKFGCFSLLYSPKGKNIFSQKLPTFKGHIQRIETYNKDETFGDNIEGVK